jgi:hypothetical protein
MYEIIDEDECNDTYGRYRMHKALELKKEAKNGDFPHIPCERTVYRIIVARFFAGYIGTTEAKNLLSGAVSAA